MAGHPVKIVSEDDGTDPSIAVQDLLKYVGAHGKPHAVWAGTESDDTQALFPVLKRYGILGYAATDGSDLLQSSAQANYPDEFTPADSKRLPDVLAAQWFKSRNLHKVGILQEAVAYTESETPLIEAALRQQGIGYSVSTISPTATDVTPEMSALKSSGADAVFAEAVGPPAGYVLAGRATVGWNVPVLGDFAFAAIDVTKLVPKSDLGSVYLVDGRCAPASASYTGIKLMKQYYAKLGFMVGAGGICSEAAGWDGTMMLYTAAQQSGSIAMSDLASTLQALKTPAEPYYVEMHAVSFTANTHENASGSPSDFVVIPIGPWIGGQVS